jgi:hypothetical protein
MTGRRSPVTLPCLSGSRTSRPCYQSAFEATLGSEANIPELDLHACWVACSSRWIRLEVNIGVRWELKRGSESIDVLERLQQRPLPSSEQLHARELEVRRDALHGRDGRKGESWPAEDGAEDVVDLCHSMRNIRQEKPKHLALTSGAWLILDDTNSMKMLPSSSQITCIASRVSIPDKRSTLVRKAAVRCQRHRDDEDNSARAHSARCVRSD